MTNTMKSLINLILMLVGLGTLTYVSLIHHSGASVALDLNWFTKGKVKREKHKTETETEKETKNGMQVGKQKGILPPCRIELQTFSLQDWRSTTEL